MHRSLRRGNGMNFMHVLGAGRDRSEQDQVEEEDGIESTKKKCLELGAFWVCVWKTSTVEPLKMILVRTFSNG